MAYTPTVWENDETEVDETNMNHIEQGIKDNDDKLQGLTSMGNIVVDSIRSKNMWKPILLGNQYNCNVSLSGDTYIFSATGTDMFYGNVATTTGTSYATEMGQLFAVKPNTTYTLTLSNSNFTKNYVSFFNLSKVSLSYQRYDSRTFTFTTPNNCYYISFRIGYANSVNGTNYSTTIQLETGSTSTTFSPYQELNLDYEKGTWKPEIQNATVNYTIQSGEYIKIGKLVYISFHLRGKITATPQYPYAFITGLPFKPSSVAGCGSFYEYAGCFDDNSTPRLMRIGFDGTYPSGFVAIQNGAGGGVAVSWWVSSNNTFYLSGSGFYIID